MTQPAVWPFTEQITQDVIYYLLGNLDLKPTDDIYKLRDMYAELQEHCWNLEEDIDDYQYEISELRDFIEKTIWNFRNKSAAFNWLADDRPLPYPWLSGAT